MLARRSTKTRRNCSKELFERTDFIVGPDMNLGFEIAPHDPRCHQNDVIQAAEYQTIEQRQDRKCEQRERDDAQEHEEILRPANVEVNVRNIPLHEHRSHCIVRSVKDGEDAANEDGISVVEALQYLPPALSARRGCHGTE